MSGTAQNVQVGWVERKRYPTPAFLTSFAILVLETFTSEEVSSIFDRT